MSPGSERAPALSLELPARYRLVVLDRVESTNTLLREQAATGAADGTLLWAKEQTTGRGRLGRTWTSPPGNLYCSVLLRPRLLLADAPQLTFVAAVAVADAVSTLLAKAAPARVTCKWPNDVLVNGKKVAGILLDSAGAGQSLSWVVIGVGINVATYPTDENLAYPATALAAEGSHASLAGVLEEYACALDRWLARWAREGFGAVRQAWLQRGRDQARQISVRLSGETVTGLFEDVDVDGALILNVGGQRRRIVAGDVLPKPVEDGEEAR